MNQQQNHIFLDADNCGSSVGYYLSISDYTNKEKETTYSLSATVVLADCAHKIDWTFSGEDVAKIDSAIAMLQGVP